MFDRRFRFFVCAVLFAALGAPAAFARDIVTLVDGTRVSGVTIMKDSYEGVAVDADNDGEIDETYDPRRVAQVEYSDTPVAYRQAMLSIRGGRLETAVEELRKALEEKDTVFWLVQYGNFHLGECLRKLGEADPALLEEARAAYRELVVEAPTARFVPPSIRGIGLTYLATEQYDRAEREFGKLVDEKYGDEWRLRGKLLVARAKGLKGEHEEGLRLCGEVAAKVEKGGLDDIATLATRTGAGVLLAAGKHDEAYDAFTKMAGEADLNDHEAKAMAYNAIGDALLGKGRPREALLAYLRVRVLYFKAADELPHALYGAARSFTILREADKARELVNALKNEYPRSAWTAKAVKELEG